MSWQAHGDWGTTRLRLFRLVDGGVADRVDGPGIGTLAPDQAARVLRDALAPWRQAHGDPAQVLLCGSAGARRGLAEAPYADCPAGVGEWRAHAHRFGFDGLRVAIAAGLACTHADGTPDVMRGEETQVFGLLAREPAFAAGEHVVVLPGTHSKWARVRDGRVTGFRSYPTGELYALLRDGSTLGRGEGDGDGDAGFEAGLARARRGDELLAHLFEARSAQLRADRTRGWALGYLSGLLIGGEVAHALAGVAADAPLLLVGDPALAARYARALAAHGRSADNRDGEACALAGLQLLGEAMAWT